MTKYRSIATEVEGVRFASRLEAKRWGELKLLERAGVISNLQRQVPFKCVVNGELITTYIADFVFFENGKRVVEETKGYRTREYLTKRKLVQALYPGVVIQEVRA